MTRMEKIKYGLIFVVGMLAIAICWTDSARADEPNPNLVEASANQNYFKDKEVGWFWYRDPKVHPKQVPKKLDSVIPMKPKLATMDPLAQIKAQGEELERLKAIAILQPTLQNMVAYLRYNAKIMSQSENFAHSWQEVVWTNPDLDNTINSPTGSAAYIKADLTSAEQTKSLFKSSNRYGLMFFFRSTCPYCHKFAPILKEFSERYGFLVVAVSLDGQGLPEYPNPAPNKGVAQSLKVDTVPALFVIEPKSRTVVAANYGLIGFSDLELRVQSAIEQIEKPNVKSEAIAQNASNQLEITSSFGASQ